MIVDDLARLAVEAEADAVDSEAAGDHTTARAHRRAARGYWTDYQRNAGPDEVAAAVAYHRHRAHRMPDGTRTPSHLKAWHQATAALLNQEPTT